MRAISSAIGTLARLAFGIIGVLSGSIGVLILLYSFFYPSIHSESSVSATEIYIAAQYYATISVGLLLVAVFCVLLLMSPQKPTAR